MCLCLCLVALCAGRAGHAQEASVAPDVVRQPLGDAWWTGPMLANSAATLPQGHFLLEPYLYDVTSTHGDSYGSLTYMQYGLTDRLTVGLVPTFGYNRVDNGPNSSGVGWGDSSVQAQYRLHQFQEGSWVPTMSVMLQETFPTGKYDRLGDRPADGFGSGAASTTLQLNTQTYFWMPNGRILRMRFNVGQTWSRSATLHDVSVYGTPEGFRGHAKPGDSLLVNAAWEYNMNRHWVLALDLTWRHTNGTPVDGVVMHGDGTVEDYHARAGSSVTWGIAPAIEYNVSGNLGFLFGVRVLTGGFRTTTSITPAIALNYVH
ncbi:transporter [Dyella terrae]|uniref:Transporter n=2 Tax=Dyella TaxID=231454 RepID=A0A4R0Z1R0_9GAMM|nr:transporter [Dyella terrae]TCI13739.1 transporter [Dyella soli]